MRFDDRLKTVLAQPSVDPHDRAVRWRQLVDLLSRAGPDAEGELFAEAVDTLRDDWRHIDEQVRAAAARAVAGRPMPRGLLALFASDKLAVSAPVLAAAQLDPEDWVNMLELADEETRRFVDSLHPELRSRLKRDPAAPAQPKEQSAATQAEEAPAIPSISEVVARIERVRHSREHPLGDEAQREPTAPAQGRGLALFRWECDPSGEISWVEGAPRGALIGRSIARSDEGFAPTVERAFAMRAPFRDAGLTIGEEGTLAGEWRVSGIPAFEPADGRFAGYRGVAMREALAPPAAEPVRIHPLLADHESLRELVHEIRTPLNAIIGFAEIIDGQYLGPADAQYRQRAAEIVAQARVLLEAVDDLDFAAKAQSGVSGKSCALAELLATLASELASQAAERGVTLTVARAPGDVRCRIDPQLAERLIRRFVRALVEAASQGERLELRLDPSGQGCRVSAALPPGMTEITLPLRLLQGLARIAGGDLLIEQGQATLVLREA